MEGSSPFTTCSTCKHEIAFGIYFCGQCGAAQLQSMLLSGNKASSATTANYDPFGPDYKPWRDTDHLFNKPHPKLPVPVLGPAGKEGSVESIPWRPTMKTTVHWIPAEKKQRQIDHIKRKGLMLKNSRIRRRQDGSIVPSGVPVPAGKDSDAKADTADGSDGVVDLKDLPPGHHGGVIYFKEHAFQRRHGRHKPAVPRQGAALAAKLEAERISDLSYERGEQTFVHGVAAYDAFWMLDPGYTVHVSLIDRSHHDKDLYVSRYFLRIGVQYEEVALVYNPTLGHAEEEVVHSSDLMVLEVLQNDLGRLLTSHRQYWVDLNLVRPDEFYMAQFLQDSLVYVAQRVRASPSLTLINLIDQVCLVEPVYEDEAAECRDEPHLAVITEQDLRLFKRRHKRALGRRQRENAAASPARARGRQEEHTAVCSPGDVDGGEDGSLDSELPPLTPGRATPLRHARLPRPGTPTPKTLGEKSQRANRAVSVALGPAGKEVSISIDKTVAQRACRVPVGALWEDQVVLAMARMSVRYPDADSLLHDPLPLRSGPDDCLFSEVAATAVSVHILPLYSEMHIAPKVITFDVSALKVLLGPATNVDATLKEGFGAANKLLFQIVQLLHFYRVTSVNEQSGEAIVEEAFKLGMTGVATIAFQRLADDHDSDSDSEEAAGVATGDVLREVFKAVIYDTARTSLQEERDAAERERRQLAKEAKALERRKERATVKMQALLLGASTRMRGVLESKRAVRRLLRARAEKGARMMQALVRLYLATRRVQRRRQVVARQRMEAEITEEARHWALEMGIDQEEPLPSPNRAALDAWKAAFEERLAAERAERLRRLPDACPCHSHATVTLNTEIKDTPLRVFGLFNCGNICEYSIRADRAALKTMYRYPQSLAHVLSRGDGCWTLTLTVQEQPELEEGEELTEDIFLGLGYATVIIGSDVLEEVGASFHHELTMIKVQEEERDRDTPRTPGSARSQSRLGTAVAQIEVVEDDPEQDAWEDAQWRAKTADQLAWEAAEEEQMRAADESLLGEERDKKVGRANLHSLILHPEHKAELFRRVCSGISISWRYDGALLADFDLETCMEMYEVFYDDDGDLVVGI